MSVRMKGVEFVCALLRTNRTVRSREGSVLQRFDRVACVTGAFARCTSGPTGHAR